MIITVIQYQIGRENYIFMTTKLLNRNEIILEIIHLTTNLYCEYVDPTFFTILSGMQS